MIGYHLHVMKTNKFKNITISLKMASPIQRKNVTMRTLLSFMMASGTSSLPSPKLLSTYLDELYGARFSTSIGTKGKLHVIHAKMQYVDPQYVNDDELTAKAVGLLKEIIYHPNACNGAFNEEILQQQKKEYYYRMQAMKDDKYSYSLDQLFSNMGEDTTLGINSYGYEDEIEGITGSDLYQYYLECLDHDLVDIYVVGDISDDMIALIQKEFTFRQDYLPMVSDWAFASTKKEPKVVVEKQDITQAKLNIGYTIDTHFTSEDHYAMTIMNGILGAFSHSLLFKIVREKHSLCYYISSSYDAFNGIMVINAGIEGNQYEKTISLIKECIEMIQNDQFDDELIDITKFMFENSLKKSNDEATSMIALRYNRDISSKEETNETYIERLNAVTREEIVAASKKIKLDTIFFLDRKESE